MNKLWIIARKDFGEAFRSRSTYIYILVLIFLTFNYFSGYNSLIGALTQQNASPKEIYDQSRIFLNGLANIVPMIDSIFVCSIFATYSVVVEKAKRNIESLMVTPVSLRQIWMGKTLSVTLPSVMIGLAVAIIGYVILNFWVVIPQTGSFIFPEPLAIVTALIIVPVLIFTVVSLVLYLQLVISNPRIANLVFFAIFFVLIFGVNALPAFGIMLDFSLIYLVVIVLCAAAAYFLSRSLTKEKVILSSKG
jgi:ABC-2 type transport system permease protein